MLVGAAGTQGRFVLIGIIWGKKCGSYTGVAIVGRWPQNRGLLSTILNGNAARNKVSGRYREGDPLSGVAVKSDSTVLVTADSLMVIHGPRWFNIIMP